MAHDHFFHILQFLHFENDDNHPNHDDPGYDGFWKIRKVFDTLNNKFCEMYGPTEHLAVDEVIVFYKGRVICRQYVPKKHKRFGFKIYKLCDSLGYTYDVSVYLGKQRQHATAQITATHRTVLQVIRRVQGLGPRVFMDSYFTSPVLFDDLFQRKINTCGTARHDDKCGKPQDIGWKSLKMERGDIVTRQRKLKGCPLER
jgi:ribosomal protein L37AE/L43A